LRDIAADLTGQLSALSAEQKSLQTNISTVGEKTTKIADEIVSVIADHKALGETLKTGNEALTNQIEALSKEKKAALAALNEAIQQAAMDVASVVSKQGDIINAVNANRDESLEKLAAISRNQEQWGRQFDVAQAQVHTMVADISRLQEEVATVQAMLNTCTQNLADLLDSENEQKIEFVEKINQNLTAIANSVSQIQESQVSTQIELQQVENSKEIQTQSQILPVIAQDNSRGTPSPR
jgi:hypothetical protein